jgi:hypothetical protein
MKTLPLITLLSASLALGATAKANGYYMPYDHQEFGSTPFESYTWTPLHNQSYTWLPFHDECYVRRPYADASYAWMLFNEQSSQTNSWLGYPQTASQGLYAMALDAQRRGAFAYADVLRRMTTVQFENEHRVASIEASARSHAQIGEMVASKQERIRQAYAELQPMYDQLLHRRRDLKGQEEIHQYNMEAAQYTARLRQLRRDEAEVGMMMRSGPRY